VTGYESIGLLKSRDLDFQDELQSHGLEGKGEGSEENSIINSETWAQR